MNGILLLDKPEDITSNRIALKVKKHFDLDKVGHTGTLDYFATGLLIITIGKATKLTEYFQKLDKSYTAVGKLGEITDTYDINGKILQRFECDITEKELIKVVNVFKGSYEQTPPPYSAKKIQGKRAYQLAKKGLKPDLKPVKVNIYDIKLLSFNFPFFEINVNCSSGTYIRSLIKDIGDKLNCGAFVYSLRRTKIGIFSVDNALSFENLLKLDKKELEEYIIPVDKALYLFQDLILDEGFERRFVEGQRFKVKLNNTKPEELLKVYSKNNIFLGIGKINKEGILQPVKVLNRNLYQF